MSELLTLGISHKTAPVGLRERFAMTEAAASAFLVDLVEVPSIREAVVISTCNRTEITVVVDDPVAAESELLAWLALRAGIRPTELSKVIYTPRNCDAARQLFRVASGIESMVIGEAEVQGQVKRAYETALAAGTTGPLTNRLFTAALQTGKRVRTETKISEGHASISSVAVDLAEQTLGDLGHCNVVIVGAGETSELTARALHEHGVSSMFVANRHADRARDLADRFGGSVVAFDHLSEQLHSADIVVAQTASPHPIITREVLVDVMAARHDRPLLLIDIAVPRDIDAACGDLPGITLLDVDDLSGVVQNTAQARQFEARRAEEIVEDEIARFALWLGSREVLPTIAELRSLADGIVDQVLSENAPRWQSASEADLERTEAIARAVVNRLLHEPTLRLKAADVEGSHGRLALIRELFGMDDGATVDVATPAASAEVRALPRRGA